MTWPFFKIRSLAPRVTIWISCLIILSSFDSGGAIECSSQSAISLLLHVFLEIFKWPPVGPESEFRKRAIIEDSLSVHVNDGLKQIVRYATRRPESWIEIRDQLKKSYLRYHKLE